MSKRDWISEECGQCGNGISRHVSDKGKPCFICTAVTAEKERCAKIADGFLMTETFIGPLYTAGHNGACSHIAAKIRSGE